MQEILSIANSWAVTTNPKDWSLISKELHCHLVCMTSCWFVIVNAISYHINKNEANILSSMIISTKVVSLKSQHEHDT